jgi:ParB family transcriptional regulator, chromosome partitioning protein
MPTLTETVKKRTALGQGLDALIPIEEPVRREASDRTLAYLPIESLLPNPYQPRTSFAEESLLDFSRSIKELGVIQPIIVRTGGSGRYEIVAGERRWRAAKMAGIPKIPAVVRPLSDAESLEIALIENVQREDLNPLDTAEAYDTLIKKFSYTHEVLAERVGKDRTNITNYLRLLRLPDPIKEDLRTERLTMGHARTLLALDDLPTQLTLSRKIVKRRLSVRELERIVQNYKKKQQAIVNPPQTRDTDLTVLEKGLSRLLATKVVVRKNNNKSGKLEIHFHSHEELLRLVDALGYSEDFA